MANIFKSKYTGEQVEEKLDNSTQVIGNPEGSAVADLIKIQIGNDIYYLPYGTSVQGNPTGDATEELTKITIGGTTYSIPIGQSGGTTVIGNPSGPAVADLTKIQIGNDIYYLPYGTSVQGNPSASATDELTKITIGGTTYSIPIGQGGGSGVSISANTGNTPSNVLNDITINGITYIVPNSNTISIRVTNSSNSTHSIKPYAWKGQVISGDDTFISPGDERYIYVTYGTLLEFEVENASVSEWVIEDIDYAVIVGGPISPSVLVYNNIGKVTVDAYDAD